MKKFLLLILFSNFFSAQNPDLLYTNWQVTKIVSENFSNDQYPPSLPFQQITTFSSASPQVSLSFFNTMTADLNYGAQNSFTVISKTCTNASYNAQVDQYFTFLCDFFNVPSVAYMIQNTGSQKTLVLYNAIFQEIHFLSANLSINENEVPHTILAPNPAQDNLIIQNSNQIYCYKIFDPTGKLVEEKKNLETKNLKIDIQNYQKGIYFINLNNEKALKFIKK